MTENKYKNGKIYKIIDIGYSMCYIGSTIQPLSKRFGHHRDTFETHPCSSAIIFKTYGKENCKCELIENVPCENKEQLKAREGFYIETMECVNKFIAGGKKSDWDKRYYEKNKETHLAKSKAYYQDHKDEIKAQKQIYRENTREHKRQVDKQYRQNNRDMLKAKQLEQILCECGCYSVRSSIARHRSSKKHKDLMEQKYNEND